MEGCPRTNIRKLKSIGSSASYSGTCKGSAIGSKFSFEFAAETSSEEATSRLDEEYLGPRVAGTPTTDEFFDDFLWTLDPLADSVIFFSGTWRRSLAAEASFVTRREVPLAGRIDEGTRTDN